MRRSIPKVPSQYRHNPPQTSFFSLERATNTRLPFEGIGPRYQCTQKAAKKPPNRCQKRRRPPGFSRGGLRIRLFSRRLRYRLRSSSRLPSFRESLRLYSFCPNFGAGLPGMNGDRCLPTGFPPKMTHKPPCFSKELGALGSVIWRQINM